MFSFSHRSLGSSHQDFYEQIPVIIRELIYRLNDNDMEVLQACNGAFTALSAHVPAEELVKNVEFMRNSIASLVSDARRRKGGVGDGLFLLPGFNMPKGKRLTYDLTFTEYDKKKEPVLMPKMTVTTND